MNPKPRSVAQQAGCQQAEAYCLMLYRDSAGNEEWIWNSRDGVTHFIVQSRQGFEANHVEWHWNLFRPYHVPAVGYRIFVTTTPERARERAEAWYDRFEADTAWGADFLKRHPDREKAIASKVQEILEYMAPHSPDLIEVTEEVRKQFLNGPALGIVDCHQRAAVLRKLAQAQSDQILELEQLQRELDDENAKLAMISATKATEDVKAPTDQRLLLEAQCRDIAELIHQILPKGTGFTLLLYDFGAEGNLAYVINARRDDMLKMLREHIQRLETRTN